VGDAVDILPEAPAAERRRHRRAGPPPAAAAPIPRVALDAAEAAAALGLSRSFWLDLVDSGRAPRGFTLGRCRRWSVAELQSWASTGCKPRTWDGGSDADKKRGGEVR